MNRLEKLTHYLPDGTPELTDNDKLAEFDYDPRDDGKWESVTETYWVTGTPQVIDVDWTYDAVGRLTDEVFNHYDDSLDYAAHYDMDLVGNRLQKTVDQGINDLIDDYFAYDYDDNDRLLTEDQDLAAGTNTNLAYSYGGTGNPATYLTGKTTTDAATQVVLETVTYSYNFAGQLSQVVTEKYEAGEVVQRDTATFGYGDNGIRTEARYKTEVDADSDPGTPLTVQSETETTYVNDPDNPTGYSQGIRETVRVVATGQITKEVVSAVGLDVIAQTTFSPNGPEEGATRVLVYDGHGSTRVLTSGTGQVLQAYAYDANGSAIGFDAKSALTGLLYSGESFDSDVNMGYLRARWYIASHARFSSLDSFSGTLDDPQSLHKYTYSQNDPINGIDPSGASMLGATLNLGVRLGMGGLTGAAIGGVWGGIDAKLGGGSFWAGFKDGAVVGGLFGASAALLGPIFAGARAGSLLGRLGKGLLTAGTGLNMAGTAIGTIESLYNGRASQGLFRLGSGLMAFGFTQEFISRLVTWANPAMLIAPKTPTGVYTTLDGLLSYIKASGTLGAKLVKWIENSGFKERISVLHIPYQETYGTRGGYLPGEKRIVLYDQAANNMKELARTLFHEFVHGVWASANNKVSEFWADVIPEVASGSSGPLKAAAKRILELVGHPAYATLPVFFNGDIGVGMTVMTYLQDYDEE